MKKIVVITTPGFAKRVFVNRLHTETGGAVSLVVIQKPTSKKLTARISGFFKKITVRQLFAEIYHYLMVRMSTRRREALCYPKLFTSPSEDPGTYLPPIFEVTNINAPEVHERICAEAPDIMVVWGGNIIKPHILACATTTLNMHTGYCPYYRGSNGNLNAILNNDFEHIGITIHDAVAEVDAGGIRAVVQVNTKRSPQEFFTELNDRATTTYIEIVKGLIQGNAPAPIPQDTTKGKNYMLKEWTYAKQHRVADRLLALSAMYTHTQ